MVLVSRDGTILMVNQQTERLFGYRRDELTRHAVDILVPVRFRAAHAAHRSSFFSEPRLRPMGMGLDLWGARKDGSEFPIEISLSPIESPQGLTVGASIRDVTARMRAESAITELRAKELERLAELERFQKLIVGRELKMIELKKEIADLKKQIDPASAG
jgi:protein-histidine pros-kinase